MTMMYSVPTNEGAGGRRANPLNGMSRKLGRYIRTFVEFQHFSKYSEYQEPSRGFSMWVRESYGTLPRAAAALLRRGSKPKVDSDTLSLSLPLPLVSLGQCDGTFSL